MKSKKIPRSKTEKKDREKAVMYFRKKNYLNLLLWLVIFVGAASTIYYVYINSNAITDSLFSLTSSKQDTQPAAVVNGEIISLIQLEQRYNIIPQEYKPFIAKADVLSQMIDELLLLQESSTQGLDANEDEIDEEIQKVLLLNQLTLDELKQNLGNISMEEYREFYRKQIILSKLVDEKINAGIQISDVDVKDYYFENPDFFEVPQALNVSHILVCHDESLSCLSNISKLEAKLKIDWVKTRINQTNFGQLATLFSDEPSAQNTKGNLGWISDSDLYDQTFLNATFGLDVNEVSDPVETVFGYHLIKVIEKRESVSIELDEVYDQINNTLFLDQQRELFSSYMEEVKKNAEIINYLEVVNS